MARNPRVVVVGQEPVARAEVQKMLALSGFAVLGEAGYGIEAMSLSRDTEPDVVIIAIEEPLIRALQTVEALADLLPGSPIIGYSSIKDPAAIRRAMLAGIKDYMVAPVKEEDLIGSIHTVLAQEERRRARMAGETDEPVAAGTVVTVFGAKGGIGKTTIATNLATALVQKTNQSVVVVDLDTRFGDVAILMDIPVERSIADLAMPEEQITREILQECIYTHNTGVAILPAPIRPTDWRSIHAGHIERIVSLLMQTYDYVVLDTPGTFNDIVARALELATMVVLVATVDMAALKDTLLAIDMLRSWNFPQDKIKLVINATNEATNAQPQEVKRMLGRDVFWSVPYDRNISTATQLGMPVVVAKPQSRAAESLTEMSYALSGVRGQQPAKTTKETPQKGGLLSRILGNVPEEKTEVGVE
ncbi:MAG: response regulator [Chloroflexi bacterium]|nr:MAG: response regulator [Chloroflexota bacterium]